MRRLLVRTMRLLNDAGIDSILPDLPGTNESLQALDEQSVVRWHQAMISAAAHFGATHVLAVRGGALVAPSDLPGWSYAPVAGAAILRQMVRMRILASRNAGQEETTAALLDQSVKTGLNLGGYRLSPGMIASLQNAMPAERLMPIQQSDLGGSGLWLRAEPDDDADQAAKLAVLIGRDIASPAMQGTAR